MAARLGVSLTHRDCAHSVRFVTGHARTGDVPRDLDWRGLADPLTTLVLYMGGRTAPTIAQRLIAEGLAQGTPAVVVSGVTRASEKRWTGTLRDLADGGSRQDAGSDPVLIGIGAAFAAVAAVGREMLDEVGAVAVGCR